MNVFILNSGRCGSSTFIKACQHIHNFSSAHESRSQKIGSERLNYPKNHIEADNRLCWFLGRLDQSYGNTAFYVHLKREKNSAADSFAKREQYGIMKAYREGILLGAEEQPAHDVALDYLHSIESNIELFLKDKTQVFNMQLENAKMDFSLFWQQIGAKGDLQKALAEWDICYNASA
ncbi:MAG: hypothetical protein Q9N68_10685 [Gammaproteobacteria bacterium]|nr:hypothetical protein [Gammaproteobacteria bacterium]